MKGSWTQPPVLLCFHSFFGSVMSPKHQRLDSYFSTFLSLGLAFSPSLSLNPFLKFHNNVSLFIPSLFNIRKNKNCQSNLSFSPSFCFSLLPPPPEWKLLVNGRQRSGAMSPSSNTAPTLNIPLNSFQHSRNIIMFKHRQPFSKNSSCRFLHWFFFLWHYWNSWPVNLGWWRKVGRCWPNQIALKGTESAN